MKKRIPNILTIIRIIFVPLFIWLIFTGKVANNLIWATFVFIVASITDYYDGMLARKFKTISDFGKIMDPLADKILILSALLAFAVKMNNVSLVIVIIIALREISVSILRNLYAKKGIYISANIWGKLKTVLQLTGIITLLVYESAKTIWEFSANFDSTIILIFNIYFWFVAIVTILSGINYFLYKKE